MTGARAYGSLWVALATLATFAVMAVVSLLPMPTQLDLLVEGGPIESLSVAGYGVCIGLMFTLWPGSEVRRRWYFPVMFALFAGRELDLDKIPFTEGLLKASQYTGDKVLLPELILSSVLLLAIVGTVVVLLLREARGFVSGLLRAKPACYAALIGLLFIGVCKSIDGLGRKLEPFGVTISDSLDHTASLIEEIGELGIPVMFALGVWLATSARPNEGEPA